MKRLDKGNTETPGMSVLSSNDTRNLASAFHGSYTGNIAALGYIFLKLLIGFRKRSFVYSICQEPLASGGP